MKQETAEVLNLDVQKLTEMLNQALAEEWLAYYQYWVGARVMEGPVRSLRSSRSCSSMPTRSSSMREN